MSILAPNRPRLTREAAAQILAQHGVTDPVAILGTRGYFRDTMGEPGKNDRMIYDDALFIISPETFRAFNANVDPSAYRRGIAVLKPGLWRYKIGIHGLSRPAAQRYKALVQAAPVTVRRDETGDDTGMFGINIHRGGESGTSSLGCQTIPPDQWPDFITTIERELKHYQQPTVPYLLTEQI